MYNVWIEQDECVSSVPLRNMVYVVNCLDGI